MTLVRAAKRQYNIVHLHSSWAGFWGRLLLPGTLRIYQPHSIAFMSYGIGKSKRLLFKLIEVALAPLTRAIISVSEFEEMTIRQAIRSVPVRRVPNVATTASSEKFADRHTAESLNVVTVGRLSRQKDPIFFAEICEQLLASERPPQVTWIGDGSDEYKRRLARAGATVTGWVGRGHLEKELKAASIYIHTAQYEGMPLSILEAASFGIPILIRNIPHLADLPFQKFSTASEAVEMIERCLRTPNQLLIESAKSEHFASSQSSDSQRKAYESIVFEVLAQNSRED